MRRLPLFRDRAEAGGELARRVEHLRDRTNLVVLALPRGGVPIGREVARALARPLDTLIVCKLGVPEQPELAMGAIASGGIRMLNWQVISELYIPAEKFDRVTAVEQREMERRERLYRGGRPPLSLNGSTAVIVDDGIATGSTMRAAVAAVRRQGAAHVVVCVPVAPPGVCDALTRDGAEVVCLLRPDWFPGVGQFYESFPQLTDEDVTDLLAQPAGATNAGAGADASPVAHHGVLQLHPL